MPSKPTSSLSRLAEGKPRNPLAELDRPHLVPDLASDAQVSFIRSLGGTPWRGMTKLEASEEIGRLKTEKATARTSSIVFEVRALFRGELQDRYPALDSDDLHVLEALTSDAMWDRTSSSYLWVSSGLSTPAYLARRTRLEEVAVEITLTFLQEKHWLIDTDGRRFTVEPLAVKFLGSERVGDVPDSVMRRF
jgi:hypothetical protein